MAVYVSLASYVGIMDSCHKRPVMRHSVSYDMSLNKL